MERLILTIAVISGLVLLTLITLIRYQSSIYETLDVQEEDPIGMFSINKENATDTFSISGSDLPDKVQEVIAMDSLINNLTITNVKKISRSNTDYYDVSFLDLDDFEIIVLYDKNGEVISQ